ncbi:hypothetical protein IMZ48_22005 [Candidatus Bathyarchaeota archaeon]|nr:hypothetical protein [Candidatus Bathyarchaeota archaeon]
MVLACGHFYAGESLDLSIGISKVYSLGSKGEYTGLKDISAALAKEVPVCPDCRRPIRQFSTRRYNQAINKAVIDETTKRFLASRQKSLANLEERLSEVKEGLKTASARKKRYKAVRKLVRDASVLRDKIDTEH